jgi:hypothetical protein
MERFQERKNEARGGETTGEQGFVDRDLQVETKCSSG